MKGLANSAAWAAALLLLTVAAAHGQRSGRPWAPPHPADRCENKAVGTVETSCNPACWMQLDSHRGCYVSGCPGWSASWSGQCNGAHAEGQGVLVFTDLAGGVGVYEGALSGGKMHGRATLTSPDGVMGEGTFAADQKIGRWRFTHADGSTGEGMMANNQRTGRWVQRHADGKVVETPYVKGEIHGTLVVRYADGGRARNAPRQG